MYDFSVGKITVVNSLIKCLICSQTILGGLYMLPKVIAFDNPPPVTLIVRPSQYSYVFIFNCTSYWNRLFTYIIKSPFLLLLFP